MRILALGFSLFELRTRFPSLPQLIPLFFPLLFMAVGLVALLSTVPKDQAAIIYKQIVFDLAGIFLILWITFLFSETRRLEEWAPLFYILAVFSLILVLFVGRVGGGSRRWLDLGIVHLQPSEFAKFAIILLLSRFVAEHNEPEGYGVKELLIPLLLLLFPVGLVLLQPDLGTAVVIGLIGCGILYIHGIRRRVLLLGTGLVVLAGIFAWKVILLPYQKQRILSFLDPHSDPLGKGYHLLQSQIALGSGGLWGRSYGKGLLSGLQFLPEHHTDFAFASFGELWGFAGGLFLLLLYAGFFTWFYRNLQRITELYPRFVVFGIFLHFLLHTLINLGMVMGLLPIVGIPLPWVSYGGSATVVNCLLFGYAWYLIRFYGGETAKHYLPRL